MKNIKKILLVSLAILFILCFGSYITYSKSFVNTDYIHEFKQDINNLLDNNLDTYFVLPDFTNYLEFKLENHNGIKDIELNFDNTKYDYKYKIYSSNDGYTYDEVKFEKEIINSTLEIAHTNIMDVFIRLRILSSNSKDYIHIKDISFLDEDGNKINNVEIKKEEPIINEYKFQKKMCIIKML